MANINHEDILAYLEEATILQLNDLVKAIEEKFGVTAAAPVAVAAVAEVANNEPTEVDVVITDIGATKVKVIKVVKDVVGLSLMEAKKLCHAIPATVKAKCDPAEAEKLKEALAEAGAIVELK